MDINKIERTLDAKQTIYYSSLLFGSVILTSILSFSFYFLVYIIGINPLYVSIGNSIALIFKAFLSPIFGYHLDHRKPTKMGKRRINFLIGGPFLVLSYIFIWTFPYSKAVGIPGGKILSILAYWAGLIVFNVSYNFIYSAFSSMLPEISNVEENRVQISGTVGIITLTGGLIGIMFPFIIKAFISESLTPQIMVIISIITGIFGLFCILLTFIKIREPIQDLFSGAKENPRLLKDNPEEPKKNAGFSDNQLELNGIKRPKSKDIIKNMFSPLKNRNFRLYQGYNIASSIGYLIPMTILIPILEFSLRLGDYLLLVLFVIIIFAFLGFFILIRISKTKGSLGTLKISLALLTSFSLLTGFYFLPLSQNIVRSVGFCLLCLFTSAFMGLFIFGQPIMSKIIDEEIENSIEKNGQFKNEEDRYKFSGKFNGVNSSLLSIGSALSYFLMGILLDDRKEDPNTLILILIINGVIFFFGMLFLNRIEFDNDATETTMKNRKNGIKKA